jgi:hypothetical protein
MTFYTCIASVAAAASAIVAWAARSDSLRAQQAASASQEQATQIAQKSVEALDRANELAEKHFADRIELERRRARAQWASLLRGWMMSVLLRATVPPGEKMPSTIRRVTQAEVNDARSALDEPTADRLHASITLSVQKSVEHIKSLPSAERVQGFDALSAVHAEVLIDAWVAEPDGIEDALRAYESASAKS